MGTQIFAIFFLLLFVGVIVGLIVGIVLWASGGKGSGEMSCGACGYHVRGLSQLSCPECGADLREAGIGRGGSPGRRTTGIVLTCICGGLVVLGCGLSGMWLFANGSSRPAPKAVPMQVHPPPQPQPVTPPQPGANPNGASADDANQPVDRTGDDETDR